MKIKLILILMSFSIMTWAESTTEKPKKTYKEPWWVTEKICERPPLEYPFDFRYIFRESKGKQQFSHKLTESEEEQFYNLVIDTRAGIYLGETERFNRKRPEPKFSSKEQYKWEQKIKILLDECVSLVGPETNDKYYNLNQQQAHAPKKLIYPIDFDSSYHSLDPIFEFRTDPHYLSGRMQKCEQTIYPYIYPENSAPCDGFYKLSDFEYQNPASDSNIRSKRQILEKKYETIYLNVRAAGLLRAITYTYYPKSFLREHADQTGLTKYIQEQETQSNKPLKHDELAKQYFGSYEKWMTSLDQFLDQKIIDLKIGA